MPRLQGACVIVVLLLVASVSIAAPEDWSSWAHHGDLILDTSPGGASVAGDVADFPLLVRLTGQGFPFDQADGRGRDVRFSDPAGNILPHQIDRWDSASGAAEIWVKVPLIKGGAADQALRVHWGKPSAPDASNGSAVFESSKGFVSAWHLGGSGNRPNAVAGGNPAVPVRYTGKESKPGIVGFADSLGWGSREGYLDLGDGYTGFGSAFHFSVWVYPSQVGDYTHFVDLGNGQATDNIILQRHATTQDLAFVNFGGNTQSNEVRAPYGLVQKKWQHLAVTVSGRDVKLFRNGVQVMSSTLSVPLNGAWRTMNFLGRSNWEQDDSFHGKMDEAWLSKVARKPDWIKLSYESQRPDQKLVSFRLPPPACQVRFGAPASVSIPEGSAYTLEGIAECATRAHWAQTGGMSLKVLDPEAKKLPLNVPRVDKDTTASFRFTAQFGETVATWDMVVHILNSIPNPEFTLPEIITWNGKDPLAVVPRITNSDALEAGGGPAVRYSWTLSPGNVDTALATNGIVLKSTTRQGGSLALMVCMDNQGTSNCKAAEVRINRGTSIRRLAPAFAAERPDGPALRDAMGRTGKLTGYGLGFIPRP